MRIINKVLAVALLAGGIVGVNTVGAQGSSLINVNMTANPSSLPAEGGVVTFTYTVTNLGTAPLTGVSVADDKCTPLNGPTGDANSNTQLETTESWVYTCGAIVAGTNTSTATAQGTSGGLLHTDTATATVTVAGATLPESGIGPENMNFVWAIFAGIMAMSALFFGLSVRKGF